MEAKLTQYRQLLTYSPIGPRGLSQHRSARLDPHWSKDELCCLGVRLSKDRLGWLIVHSSICQAG